MDCLFGSEVPQLQMVNISKIIACSSIATVQPFEIWYANPSIPSIVVYPIVMFAKMLNLFYTIELSVLSQDTPSPTPIIFE